MPSANANLGLIILQPRFVSLYMKGEHLHELSEKYVPQPENN